MRHRDVPSVRAHARDVPDVEVRPRLVHLDIATRTELARLQVTDDARATDCNRHARTLVNGRARTRHNGYHFASPAHPTVSLSRYICPRDFAPSGRTHISPCQLGEDQQDECQLDEDHQDECIVLTK